MAGLACIRPVLYHHSSVLALRFELAAFLQDTLNQRLQQKEQTRTALRQQLETQSRTFSNVEKDAQALLLKALHAGRKVTVKILTSDIDYHHQVIKSDTMSSMSGSSSWS